MNSLNDLTKKGLTPQEIAKITNGNGEVVCHKGDGLVSISDTRPLCSCGRPVIKLESATDPGTIICCESVFDTYHLPETERRAIPKGPA